MRLLPTLSLSLAFITSDLDAASASGESPTDPGQPSAPAAATNDIKSSVVRVNSTQQSWNPWQPWEKNPPRKRRALAAIVAPQRVLTTAELAADATYLEFESIDGTRFIPAKVAAVDYETNLVLLAPASEAEGTAFFKDSNPLAIKAPPKPGASLEIVQVEENGIVLRTPGTFQSLDVKPSFLAGQAFLTYLVKASMQSAASSYSLPVLHHGTLAGVLSSYDSKDQICDVVSTEIVTRFLKEAADGDYQGTPSLGVSVARTEDPSFRQWLKLTEDQGGLYIQSVRKGGAAALAGMLKGDVLLAVEGQAIDRRGYYQHPDYGSLAWGHLVRGSRSPGDVVTLSLLRAGKPLELKATLRREEDDSRLVPNHLFDKAPNYLVKGGLLFQELSRPMLEGFGQNWQSSAPLELLDAYEHPEKLEEEVRRVVILSGVIPTPATVGYERVRTVVVHRVNGRRIRDIKELIEAFQEPRKDIHEIELPYLNLTIHLDEKTSSEVDAELLQRGITRLSRSDNR